jgi:hypothetical protein
VKVVKKIQILCYFIEKFGWIHIGAGAGAGAEIIQKVGAGAEKNNFGSTTLMIRSRSI